MNKKTLDALNGSISKWEKIINDNGEDEATNNCSLCKEFYGLYIDVKCEECPIYKKTGYDSCDATPYKEWTEHQHNNHEDLLVESGYRVYCPECKKIAKRELKFLKSLLKE